MFLFDLGPGQLVWHFHDSIKINGLIGRERSIDSLGQVHIIFNGALLGL